MVPITAGEAILRRERREISILVAREEVTITHARYAAGEQVAGPHVHHEHTDTFYELEGELTLVIGARGRDRHGLLRRIRRRAARGSPLLPQRQRPARALAHHPRARWGLRGVHASAGSPGIDCAGSGARYPTCASSNRISVDRIRICRFTIKTTGSTRSS